MMKLPLEATYAAVDGAYGDVTVTSGGTVWTITNGVVTNAKAAVMPANTVKANATAASAAPADVALLASQLFGRGATGDIAPIVLGTNLSMTGATLNAAGGGGGGGDMVLATAQTNSGLKTFLDATFGLRNFANTFTALFTNTNTAARTYTLKDASGTLAFTSDITGVNSGTNTGDQTITLTGDVTGTGTGSFAATVAANAITLAKMAQVGTATFLGRATAATGNVESLSVAQTKTVLAYTPADIGAATAAQANATHTGDATGATALTLATVNANVGAFGSATAVAAFTVNGKGLTTAASAVAIAIPSTQVTDFSTSADARIGAASINALADVIITTPATGQVIKFNGTNWINDTDATGGGGVTDGDKGDVIVSGTGTVWNLDPAAQFGIAIGVRYNIYMN